MTMPKSVRARVFSNIVSADRAVNALLAAGFTKKAITVVCADKDHDHFKEFTQHEPAGSHTLVSAASGGVIGAVLGGLALAGGVAATGGAAILFVGPLLAGAGAGTFVGAMMSRGFEPEVASFYDQALTKGEILVAVQDESERQEEQLALAESVLSATGPDTLAMTAG